MFSRMQLTASANDLTERFSAMLPPDFTIDAKEISGFDHARHPIIRDVSPDIFDTGYRWGLVPPAWRKRPHDIWNHTISAKLEYLGKRKTWQQVSANRCLIPVTGFYEFHWNDPKGKSKTKYFIRSASEEIFALGGLYSEWQSPEGTILNTFAVCTTAANELMTFIHNKDAARNYHRMPVVINRGDEKRWLDPGVPAEAFAFPQHRPQLIANTVDEKKIQGTLF